MTSLTENFKSAYRKHYKRFFIIPAIAVLFCVGVLLSNFVRTGELVAMGIDLKGGVVVTVPLPGAGIDANAVQNSLRSVPGLEAAKVARIDSLSGGKQSLSALQFEIAGNSTAASEFSSEAKRALESLGAATDESSYDVKTVEPAIAGAILVSTYLAVLTGFALLGVVIFLIFRNKFVIATVLSCIFLDFLGALAVMDLFGISLSPLAIASLLMLIGFSIDSDILITTAVLKNKEGAPVDRAFFAMRTGITMVLAAAASLSSLYFLSGAAVIRDMTLILLGGLAFDLIHTWFTNLGVLLLMAEKKVRAEAV